jgi:hypothetical protein
MAAGKANDRLFIRYLNKLKKTVRQGCHDSRQHHLPQLWVRVAIPQRERRFRQADIPAAVLTVSESGQMAVAQLQGEDTATFRRSTKRYFRWKVMLVYESPEITFEPRNILFRDLDKILPA